MINLFEIELDNYKCLFCNSFGTSKILEGEGQLWHCSNCLEQCHFLPNGRLLWFSCNSLKLFLYRKYPDLMIGLLDKQNLILTDSKFKVLSYFDIDFSNKEKIIDNIKTMLIFM